MSDRSIDSVRAWLLDYAWSETSPEEKAAIVDCILSQDGWRYIDAVADSFSGAQFNPGPEAYSEGQEFALSALYECHEGPHQPTCPDYRAAASTCLNCGAPIEGRADACTACIDPTYRGDTEATA